MHVLIIYQDQHVKEETEHKPTSMNAFELISLNQGLNLDNLFEAKEVRTENSEIFLLQTSIICLIICGFP